MSEDLDGCELDFSEDQATSADEIEALLIPEGEEDDEDED